MKTKDTPKQYVIYSRKSKFTGKGESIENQIELCRRFLAMHFGEDAAENVLAYLEDLKAQMLAGDQRKEIIQRYTHVEHLTREMVEILIDYITVGKRVPRTQDVPIEIHWNF